MPPTTALPHDSPRILRWLLLAAAAASVVVFLFGVSQRLLYPFEVEWMEGAMVDHSSRVANGLPLYCEPGPEHVPFLYTPLTFWLGGLLMLLGIDGLFALRALATVATIGTAMLIGHWVRRETGRVGPGLVASGLFLGGYGWLAWWYDLARNDMQFVFACVATGYVLRHGGHRRWLLAAALATLAFLAKQSALMWLPAIGIGALCHDWRNALRFVGTAAAGIGGAIGWMHLASDGWSTFFIFEMPHQHVWNNDYLLAFWTYDLRPMLPLVVLGLAGFAAQWRAGRRGEALLLAGFGCGGLATSWFSRLHVGGFDNVLMYGFAAACVIGPVAVGAGAARPWQRFAAAVLLLVQFGALAWECRQRAPLATLMPSAAHQLAHEQLAAFVAAQPGPVWIPAHGGIALRAGKGTGAHGQAIFDLLQLLPKQPDGLFDLTATTDRTKLAHLSPRGQHAITAFFERVTAALRTRHFAAIVVDSKGAGIFPSLFAAGLAGADGVAGSTDDPYRRRDELLTHPPAIRPLVGYNVSSPYALVAER